jgi:hypothetical protein
MTFSLAHAASAVVVGMKALVHSGAKLSCCRILHSTATAGKRWLEMIANFGNRVAEKICEANSCEGVPKEL